MELSITYMTGLANSFRGHFRFYEYDYSASGEHAKLYSWVFDDGKVQSCDYKDEKNRRVQVFPSKFRWNPIYKENRKNIYDIIR